MEYSVNIFWDDEAYVWVASSEDENVGLALEAGSFDLLLERVRVALPEMLKLNSLPSASKINIHCDVEERVYA